jgi:biopolymer transport protein ExbD
MKNRNRLLASTMTRAFAAVPVAAPKPPLQVTMVVARDSTCTVAIDDASFVLPDAQPAFVAALAAMPGKARPVTIALLSDTATPQRYIGGVMRMLQMAGFAKVSVVADPAG